MANWDKIGSALAGFGAGYRGAGTEFLALEEVKAEKLSNQRLQAAATDMYDAYNMLEAGDLDGAMDLGERRYAAIMKLNGDPSDTVDYMEILSSDPSGQKAQKYLENGLNMAIAQGFKVPANFGPKEDTTLVQNLVAAGVPRNSPEMKAAILANLNRQGTTVNVGDKGVQKAWEKLAELQVARITTAVEEGDAAEETLASVQQLRGIDASQGGSVPLREALANMFATVGIDTQELFDVDLTNTQAFNSVTARMVNQVLNQAKGPQTEGDAQRSKQTLVKLGNTPEANIFILDTLEANALRKIERSNFLQDSIDNGVDAKDANKAWNKFKLDTPMLSSVGKVSKNGIPVYFFQFKEQAKANRPDVSDAEIVAAWRTANK